MKRITAILIILALAIILGVTTVALDPIQTKTNDLTERQDKAHEAANILRELGYADDSSEIRGLSEIWWDAQEDIEFYGNLTYIGEFKVTGYTIANCGKSPSHPAYGITASGKYATPYYTAAAHKSDFDFGKQIYIDGIDLPKDSKILEVQDRGVPRNVIDVCMATVDECYAVTGRYQVYEVR